jgi:hypothetical protein
MTCEGEQTTPVWRNREPRLVPRKRRPAAVFTNKSARKPESFGAWGTSALRRTPPIRSNTRNFRLGSRLCENSRTFSHGPISFAFSGPETVQRQRNHEDPRSARSVAKFRGVLTRPRPLAVIPRGCKNQPDRAAHHAQPELRACGRVEHQ